MTAATSVEDLVDADAAFHAVVAPAAGNSCPALCWRASSRGQCGRDHGGAGSRKGRWKRRGLNTRGSRRRSARAIPNWPGSWPRRTSPTASTGCGLIWPGSRRPTAPPSRSKGLTRGEGSASDHPTRLAPIAAPAEGPVAWGGRLRRRAPASVRSLLAVIAAPLSASLRSRPLLRPTHRRQ